MLRRRRRARAGLRAGHPDIDLIAVTTVADDASERAHIALRLLELAGRDDVEVAPGVGWDEPPAGRLSWFGHEGEGLLDPSAPPPSFDRDGVSVLLDATKDATDHGGVEVAVVGMQSNIAAAVDADPAPSIHGSVVRRHRHQR